MKKPIKLGVRGPQSHIFPAGVFQRVMVEYMVALQAATWINNR